MRCHLVKPGLIHWLIDQRFCHLLSDTSSDFLSKEPKLSTGPTLWKLSTLSLWDSKRFWGSSIDLKRSWEISRDLNRSQEILRDLKRYKGTQKTHTKIYFSFPSSFFFSSSIFFFPFPNTFTFSVSSTKKDNFIFLLQIFSEYHNINKGFALFTSSSFNCFLLTWTQRTSVPAAV